jgi:hypothetical protein
MTGTSYASGVAPESHRPAPVTHGQDLMRRQILLPFLVAALMATACSSDAPPAATPAPGVPTAPGPAEPDAGGEGPDAVDDRPLSPLTGMPTDADRLALPVLIVKIENSPNARPQSGLDVADIVVEEVVEGGITRFFVLFHSELPDVAGPVRSARPVDTELLGGFGASGFAFSGARAEVQELLAKTPAVLITEGAAGFYRDAVRSAPHNLYVRPEETQAAVASRGGRALVDIGWVFDATAPAGALACPAGAAGCPDPGASVVVEMSAAYRSGWTYDRAQGVYRRDQNGRPFTVTGDGSIGADNVVILATRHYVGGSGYDETDATTTQAPALVLRDGNRYAAVWVKPTAGDLLLLQTPDGRPFPLKPGRTWVHLPPAQRLPSVG